MNKYSKKIILSVVFSIVILFMSLQSVNAVTITETTENDEYDTIANNTIIIGITKFEAGQVLTAGKVAEATYNDISFNLDNNGFYEIPKIYYYLAGRWYELDSENNAMPITDETTIEDLNNQDIYYVNNVQKLIEFEYNPTIKDGYELKFFTGDEETDKLVKYENGILHIPATLTRISVHAETPDNQDGYHIEDLIKQHVSDLEFISTTAYVSTLDELKKALNNDLIEAIQLQADIEGINETLTIVNPINLYGNNHKLQFNELPENSSGLSIVSDWAWTYDLTVEMTAKEGIQGINGIQVFNSVGVDLYNVTVSNADIGILVNGSEVATYGVILNNNEFGGIEVSKNAELENKSNLYVYNNITMNNESGARPVIYVENEQGSVYFRDMEELVVNIDIPTILGKNQKFYYINETNAEKIEVSSLTELKNALSIKEVTEITLTQDLEVSEAIVLDHSVTINGNGKTITGAEDVNVFQVSGTDTVLTINNAKIVTTGDGTAVRIGEKDLANGTNLKAIIGEDVEITSKYFGVTVFGENSAVDFYGTINITDDGYGIAGNGTPGYEGTTINVKDGAEITANKGYALYIPQDGVVNIEEGSTLTGASVIGIKAGVLNVNGGTLTATGDYVKLPSASYNGKNPTGDVIAVEVNDSYIGGQVDKNIQINVTGGTLASTNAYVIREVNVDSSAIGIEVTGPYNMKMSPEANVNIYLDEQPQVSRVEELKAALTSEDVTEVTLLADLEVTEALVANHTMTINGNGKTITGAENVNVFQVSGTDTVLTINNAKIVATGEGTGVKIGEQNLANGTNLKAIIGEDVEITSKYFGVTVFGENSAVDFYGTINITDDGYGIAGNGTPGYEGTTINVKNGAEITANKGYAIYAPQDGTINIEEGSILTGASVVAIKSGVLNVTGGTLTATGEFVELPSASYNGKNPTGDVIAVEVNDSYTGGQVNENIQVNVTGGTLSVTDNRAYMIREVNVDSSDIEIVVTGLYPNKQVLSANVNAYIAE